MRLMLPLPPSTNRAWRAVNGRVLLSYEAREWKEKAALVLAAQRPEWHSGAVEVRIAAYFRTRRHDLDNCCKLALDALKRVAFHDDRQVERLVLTKYTDARNPRLEVDVMTYEPVQVAGGED